MALIMVKHVQKRGVSAWRYRRKVPESLRKALGKTEIVIPLGNSEVEMLRRYPKVHAQAEKDLALASAKTVTMVKGLKVSHSEREMFEVVKANIRERGFNPSFDMVVDHDDPSSVTEWGARSYLADQILEQYDIDPETGDPVGVTRADFLRVRALNSGLPPAPAPTFADAAKLYLTERVGDDRKRQQQLDRILAILEKSIGLETPLAKISRSDARQVRDEMLDHLAPSSVKRYLNTVRAVFNFGINEYDLRGQSNPFQGVNPKKDIRTDNDTDRDSRRTFTVDELRKTRERIFHHASQELGLIWRILEGTGCRLAEVCGLPVSDVQLDHRPPFIKVSFRPNRRIKGSSSIRWVPLVGDALAAAQTAMASTANSEYLFPRYAEGGADSASAALGKHVRACVSDSKVVTYSLRHNLKDRLILAQVPNSIQDFILGHSSGAVSEVYGSFQARLDAGHTALSSLNSE